MQHDARRVTVARDGTSTALDFGLRWPVGVAVGLLWRRAARAITLVVCGVELGLPFLDIDLSAATATNTMSSTRMLPAFSLGANTRVVGAFVLAKYSKRVAFFYIFLSRSSFMFENPFIFQTLKITRLQSTLARRRLPTLRGTRYHFRSNCRQTPHLARH